MSISRHHVGPRMSQIVVYGDTAYLAGQVADDTTADVGGQTRQILDKIDRYLAEAGSDKSKLLQAQVWLADISSFAAMNEVWDAWVTPQQPPARACVEAKLARPEILVEIMVTAAR